MHEELVRQLGSFAKLPPEIRLQIWENVFSSVRFHAQSPNRDRLRSNKLSILYTNRYLYDEVAHHLYSSLSHEIWLWPSFAAPKWMTVRIASKWLSVQWDLEDKADIRRHFQNFPCQKMPLTVKIPAPTKEDPASIILLWQKVNDLIDGLGELSGPSPRCPHVEVWLSGNWHDSERKPTQTIKYPDGYLPDHDIVAFPFLRLASQRHTKLPGRVTFVLNDKFAALRNILQSRPRDTVPAPQDGGVDYENTALVDIDHWLLETGAFLDTKLDTINGHTAEHLRVDRFSKWFEHGEGWKSTYEERFLSYFPENRDIILKHDPDLAGAARRHKLAFVLYHRAHDKTKGHRKRIHHDPETEGPGPRSFWDSKIWHKAYPNGISPLNCTHPISGTSVKSYEHALYDYYRQSFESISRFSDTLNWWGLSATRIINKTPDEGFCCAVCEAHKSPCWWCKEYGSDLLCEVCRQVNETGKWQGKGPSYCRACRSDATGCWKCLKYDLDFDY